MGFLDSIGNGIGKIKEDMANKAAMNAQRKAEAAALDAQYRAYANSKAQEIANNILQYGDDSKGGFWHRCRQNYVIYKRILWQDFVTCQ
mgnify:CR=1 FL=1